MRSHATKNSSYQFHLFATRADYEPVIRYCEQNATLKYARFGDAASERPEVFYSAFDIPNFGISMSGRSGLEGTLIVTYRDVEILAPRREIADGRVRYTVDQLENPVSVVFLPGGVFENRAVIQGELSTLAEDRRAIELFRLFARGLRKFFVSVDNFYWLGPEAVQLLKEGYRLTSGIGRNPEQDFKIELLNMARHSE